MSTTLVVPAEFSRYDGITNAASLARLDAWKSNIESLLRCLDLQDVSGLSISELANFVFTLAPLTAVAQWTSPEIRSLASAHLARIPTTNNLVTCILTQLVKPLFAPTPHPLLHTSTARVLSRPADVQDTYIEQPWKEHPGLDEVIRWCLLNTQSLAYESIWPLFLPPIMSFLDDYQLPYKLLGVRLVSDLLARVPSDLLLRTGMDALMFSSLTNSLSHLRDPSTPIFIPVAVTTILQLIDLTTPSVFPIALHEGEPKDVPNWAATHNLSPLQSKSLSTRFSRLSTLLSSSLLGTVIQYTPTFPPPVSSTVLNSDPSADPQHVDSESSRVSEMLSEPPKSQQESFNLTLVAAAQALPPVLSALGIGSARFLKAIIPILAEWISSPLPIFAAEVVHNRFFTVDTALHLASLSSLSILFHTCAPRIEGWSTTIIDALGRCWVGCLDIEGQKREIPVSKDNIYVLKKQLRDIAMQLAKVCPSVTKVCLCDD